jgi:hypothetical protein
MSMADIDPCATLTDGEIETLGLEHARRFTGPPSPESGNVPSCTWVARGSAPVATVYVQGVTYRGFDDVRADSSAAQNLVDIKGFRAVTRDNSIPSSYSCQVFVDVADGQLFQASYEIDAGADPSQTCPRAVQAADFGMTYLLNR